MIPMEIRKIIIADHDDGMEIKAISQAVRVNNLSIASEKTKNRYDRIIL
jgi:hypothetical protein